MSVYRNLFGTMKDLFHVGGPKGSAIKNILDGLSVRTAADDDFQNISIKQASGVAAEHGVNWEDLRDANALMQFSFDGATAPAAGTNTGTYGMCHTSGGAYTAGQVYYDDGAALRATKIPVGTRITTGTAISGTIDFIANGTYVAHSASAPFSWTLKGDGMAGGHGLVKTIELAIDTAAQKISTSSIPADAIVHSIHTGITTGYDPGTTIEVILDGTSSLVLQPANENVPDDPNVYLSDVENGDVTASNEGNVVVNIGGSPSAGAGKVIVKFTPVSLS